MPKKTATGKKSSNKKTETQSKKATLEKPDRDEKEKIKESASANNEDDLEVVLERPAAAVKASHISSQKATKTNSDKQKSADDARDNVPVVSTVVDDDTGETVDKSGEHGESLMKEDAQVSSGAKTVTIKLSKKFVLTFITAFVLALTFVGGLMYVKTAGKRVQPLPSPTASALVSPSPTAEPEAQLSQFSIQVLNGAGIAGIAGSTRETLEDQGFVDVAVGNADSYDYVETEVSLKSSVPEFVMAKIEAVLSEYVVVAGDELAQDHTYDIVIIVGSEKSLTSPEDVVAE